MKVKRASKIVEILLCHQFTSSPHDIVSSFPCTIIYRLMGIFSAGFSYLRIFCIDNYSSSVSYIFYCWSAQQSVVKILFYCTLVLGNP